MFDAFIDAASKLAAGGPTLIMLFFLIVTLWGIKTLFDAYRVTTETAVAAVAKQTNEIQMMTRAIEANERASIANKAAIEALKEVLLTWIGGGAGGVGGGKLR